jgi:hypothetical protein
VDDSGQALLRGAVFDDSFGLVEEQEDYVERSL